MKKLTFKEAIKTPNIAFIATPEQLKQLNIPKQLPINLEIPNIVLLDKCGTVIKFTEYVNEQCEEWFKDAFTPYMVEIIEEDSLAFNSQQEAWQWLVEGNKCNWKCDSTNTVIVGFKDGTLHCFNDNKEVPYLVISDYSQWTKYKEPEYIIVNGFQVPKPITDLPNLGKPGINNTVYVVSLSPEFHFALGEGNSYIRFFFENGLCHTTKEAAITHAKAMLGY